LRVEFTAHFTPRPDGAREPLLTAGHQAGRYFLIAEHRGGKVELVSQGDASTDRRAIEAGAPVAFVVSYAPDSGDMTIHAAGVRAMVHRVGMLVTAPAQVTPGENRIDPNVAARRFSGALTGIRVELPCKEPCGKN
jgi:hypothetical protein